jgi:hypothetical protein
MTETKTAPSRTGALTTRLNSSLERARAALRPHASLIAGGTLAELETMLAEFNRRRVRIALYGEVKAGKSTLLNAVAGAELSPVAFEPLTSIPLRVTYGESTVWRVGDRAVENGAEVARLMRSDDPGASEVVVETALDLLQLGGQVDLLDTPGVGSDDRFDSITAELLNSLDAVVLVVRYPALFTQATRRLMDGLQIDMGKLFVVWNVDQACSELTAAERTQHTETLRANVAGAHDLFLVDARTGFEATKRRDAAAIAASGLGAFTAAVTRFVASAGRDLAAVREASKRSKRFLGGARKVLQQRHASLEEALREARERLQVSQARADAAADGERTALADFENTVRRLADEHRSSAAKLAADLRQRLRAARSRWARNGNATALAESVAVAAGDYADAVEAVSRQSSERLQAEAGTYGTGVSIAPRPRAALDLGDLAPEERLAQATNGNFQWLRRALWRRWYLPGLESLMGGRVDEELAAQTGWLESTTDAVVAAARTTLESRLAAIAAKAQAEQDQIKTETDLDANQAEFEQLSADLPVITAEVDNVAHIATEARSFI